VSVVRAVTAERRDTPPPVSKMQLGVSVVNTGFVEQRVTLVVSMKPTNGPLSAQSQTSTSNWHPCSPTPLRPEQSASYERTRHARHSNLGAPDSPNLARSKSYRVELYPPSLVNAALPVSWHTMDQPPFMNRGTVSESIP